MNAEHVAPEVSDYLRRSDRAKTSRRPNRKHSTKVSHWMGIPAFSDVTVIGGGPAGLAAAIAIAQKGYRASLFDCAAPPVDKACGEGLMPDSLGVLQRLGVEIPPEAGARFRGIRFSNGRSSVLADFPRGVGIALRRTALHTLLKHRAEACGVDLFWGVKHVQLVEGGVSVDGQFIASKLVIGADGQNSKVRREAGLDRVRTERRRFGFRRHYRTEPWSSYMELHWGPKSQIYITPVTDGEICVSLISRDPQLRLESALKDYPEVSERLRGALPISSERGALTVSRSLRSVCRPGLALVGDASGSVDAVTGEGMCLSFKQALSLADAFASRDLQSYAAAHRAIGLRPRTMASLMLILDRHSGIERRVLAALARHPEVFASLLAIHVGERSFGDLVSWQALEFCRAFLVA
jgi:menaquinone-9 beta-reductase